MSANKTEYEHHEVIDMASYHSSEKHPQAVNPVPVLPPVTPLFKPGNPAAVGFSSFALGSFVLGLYSTGKILYIYIYIYTYIIKKKHIN